MRRSLLLLLLPIIAACSSEEPASERQQPADTVRTKLQALEEKAQPGTLGAMMLDLETGEARGINAEKPMPLQSVFKLPLAIAVLDKVDKGELSLDDTVTLTRNDLSIAHSPIAADFENKKEYTIGELLRHAVAQSDNTAADILMERIGGPAELTSFFQDKGIGDFRVDRYERELQPQVVGLPEFDGQWIGWDAFEEAQGHIPTEAQRAALRLYLADPRDRMSPEAAVQMLAMLEKGQLLSPNSTEKIMEILRGTTTGPDRLKAGVPSSAVVYHKTGTGPDVEQVNSATNDIGIIELAGGRKIAVAAFLSGSELPPKERAAIIAEIGRLATEEFAEAASVR